MNNYPASRKFRAEPKITRVVERVSNDDYDHIECTFDDGQKFAAILVDKDFPELSTLITRLLSEHIKDRQLSENFKENFAKQFKEHYK